MQVSKILISTTLLLGLVSCGKNENTSGKNPNTETTISSKSSTINTILQENPCYTGMGRTEVEFPLQGISLNSNKLYVGATFEGDIAIVKNSKQGPVMSLYLCDRPGATQGQGQLLGNPILNNSQYCKVNDITQAQVTLPSQMGNININFQALSSLQNSSLCQ
jgi:hypothetical protein